MTQLAFPMPAQERNAKREADDIYAATLYLRRRQFRCYRCGRRRFRIDGRQVSATQLREIATALGWKP